MSSQTESQFCQSYQSVWTAIFYCLFYVPFTFVRRKRQSYYYYDSYENDRIDPNDIPVPYHNLPPTKPLHLNNSWPTASNITEDAAKRECTLPAMDSAVYTLCINFTQDAFPSIVRGCVDDVQVCWTLFNVILIDDEVEWETFGVSSFSDILFKLSVSPSVFC